MEQIEELKKSVSDLVEMVKKDRTEDTQKIETIVKNLLTQHPGFTPATTIVLPSSTANWTKEKRIEAITKKMPKELNEQSDDILLLSKMLKCKPNELKSWAGFSENLGDFKKALDVQATGGGKEWVPTDFSTQLYEMIRLELKVAALFPSFAMPSNPYTSPIQLGGVIVSRQAENTGDTGQTIIPVSDTGSITGSTTWTATKMSGRILLSKELEEDSVIPMLPFLKKELAYALSEGVEGCIINGDTGTHEDTDITGVDYRTCWKGLRALANENSYTSDLSDFTFSNLIGLRGSMGKYGINPANLALITGIKGYIKMLKLAEVITVDKYGNNATVIAGELAKIGGVPIVVSSLVRDVLSSAGIYDVAGTKTCLHFVYRNGFAIGERRPITTQLLSELYSIYDQDALVCGKRTDFQSVFPIASNTVVWSGLNFS